jgi:hypothetical protein
MSLNDTRARRVCRTWIELEDNFLRENYSTKGAEYCAYKCERTINAIRIRALVLGLTNSHKRRTLAERVLAMKSREETPEPITLPPAVIERDFIRPPSLARLMAGRA